MKFCGDTYKKRLNGSLDLMKQQYKETIGNAHKPTARTEKFIKSI